MMIGCQIEITIIIISAFWPSRLLICYIPESFSIGLLLEGYSGSACELAQSIHSTPLPKQALYLQDATSLSQSLLIAPCS